MMLTVGLVLWSGFSFRFLQCKFQTWQSPGRQSFSASQGQTGLRIAAPIVREKAG